MRNEDKTSLLMLYGTQSVNEIILSTRKIRNSLRKNTEVFKKIFLCFSVQISVYSALKKICVGHPLVYSLNRVYTLPLVCDEWKNVENSGYYSVFAVLGQARAA